MKLRSLFIVSSFLLFLSFSAHCQVKSKSKTSVGLQTGLNRGFGISGNLTIQNIAEGLPGNIRFAIGHTWLDPGIAADARKIFINDATNGTPEKKGYTNDFRLDYMMPHKFFNFKDSYLVFGPRYSSFNGNFNYVGGNENFDIKTKQWGIGLGAENYFKMTRELDLGIIAGLDYFFNSTLKGHDTSYSPNNDNVNGRNDDNDEPYTYKDANKAVKQPQFMPRILIGIQYHF